ncbi:MAG: nucleotidyltransferase family protein [Thermodesulfobacteriota bacterium]|nr:nucleotidyltransferase family protein [Thermodesulfobacteriota bacterium]
MESDKLLKNKRNEILQISEFHGARNIRVFGSVARGEAGRDSDIDFLVDLDLGRSLLDLGGLLVDLEQLLGRKVDVVTEKGLHWYIRDKIIKEAKPL